MSALCGKDVVGKGVDAMREPPLLVGREAAARMLGCSPRHVARLVDAGQMPQPVKLGGKLVRWPRKQIEDFVSNGCRPVAARKGGGSKW